MSDPSRENPPTDAHASSLVTHDEPVPRGRRAPRPLWTLVPRAAGYGVVFFVIWMVLTIMFPNVFTRSSERAVVNNEVTLVTSPVEGVVTEQHVTAGKPFDANQPLATVQNPNVDRALLIDLTGKKLDNQQREDARAPSSRATRASSRRPSTICSAISPWHRRSTRRPSARSRRGSRSRARRWTSRKTSSTAIRRCSGQAP